MTGVVRLAEPRDLALLEAIENTADSLLVDHVHASAWDPAPTGEARASSPGFVLVVSQSTGEEAVGFVHVLEVDGHAHLEQLSVLPGQARRGLGRMLVEAAKNTANEHGYDRITLRTYADVPWNAPFYSTCGFVESEPQTEFHRRLVEAERDLGLEKYGRRIQMTAATNPDIAKIRPCP
ncbi:MAG TPA: GNAT family N-acetyltransferase [Galbitalea sp.]